MDLHIEHRWKSRLPPFDGDCLYVDYIPIGELWATLTSVMATLREFTAVMPLYRFDDWHNHDGYVTERSPANWETLADVLRDETTLCNTRNGDLYVRWAIYPEDFSFLLRIHILDEYEALQNYPGVWGDFDLCGSSSLIDRVRCSLNEQLRGNSQVCNAKEFFDIRYSG